MIIDRLVIKNFKSYKGVHEFRFNKKTNILVGNNEVGKSTILEAIHIALTGVFRGKYLKNDLSSYLFNREVELDYLESLGSGLVAPSPDILFELYFLDDESVDVTRFKGDGNSKSLSASGVSLRIHLDENYSDLYQELVEKKASDLKSIPIEYYTITRKSFSRKPIVNQVIPLKSAYLDSSNGRFVNGSDAYVSRVIGDYLSDSEKVDVAQAYREMRVSFGEDDSVKAINKAIGKSNFVEGKNISISVAAPSQSSWESSLTAYLDGVPFNFIGQGEQSIIKVSLAMSEKKTKNANVALIEEPENHLSHSKLNELLLKVDSGLEGKQVFITTHSSFVANKLGLDNLILLGGEGVTTFSDLSPDTQDFFRKLPGYDVLRMILCKSVVLVEGDCDELIFQKAYMDRNDGRLPIEDGIEVISVGTSFLRFLEISEKIKIPTIVITDNDGDVEALRKKYKCYLGNDKKDNIEVFYQDAVVDYSGSLESYNNNTLEPEMLRANGIDIMNLVLDSKTKYDKDDDILSYMKNNKTKCALRVFDYNGPISYPDYINKAVAYYD